VNRFSYKPSKPIVFVVGFAASLALVMWSWGSIHREGAEILFPSLSRSNLKAYTLFVCSIYIICSLLILLWYAFFPKEFKIDNKGIYMPKSFLSRTLVHIKYTDIQSVDIKAVAGLEVVHIKTRVGNFKIPQMWFASDQDFQLVSQSISFRKYMG